MGFIGEKIVKKRFRGILKNPPITPKLFNRFLKINSTQIVPHAEQNDFAHTLAKSVICYSAHSRIDSKMATFGISKSQIFELPANSEKIVMCCFASQNNTICAV